MCVAEAVSIGSRRGRFPVAACGIPEALGRLVRDGLVDARAAATSLGLDPEEVERMLA